MPRARAVSAPKIFLIDRNNPEITARGEVGVDYNNEENIEYTKYGAGFVRDGYFVEVPYRAEYSIGANIKVYMENTTSPPTMQPTMTATYVSGNNWREIFAPTHAERIKLGPGALEISYEVVTAAGYTYVSAVTYMTAVLP